MEQDISDYAKGQMMKVTRRTAGAYNYNGFRTCFLNNLLGKKKKEAKAKAKAMLKKRKGGWNRCSDRVSAFPPQGVPTVEEGRQPVINI